MSKNPDGTTGAATTASGAQSHLPEWNRTEVAVDSRKCVYDLFDEQVLRTPDRIAVICRDQALTYAGLHERAQRLAHRLGSLGAGPETIVVISMERSVEMMVALLGVLKAGAAYLPIDPGFPADRIAFMLHDSAARVILTQRHLAARFANSPATVMALGEAGYDEAGLDSIETRGREVPSSALAYLMYTSGSTGKPKGVMVEHRNVVNFFAGMDRVIGAQAGVWLAATSISFDISVLELLWTLTCGFTVVVQPGADCLSATGEYSVSVQLSRHRVTHFQCTPTLARILIRSPEVLVAMKGLKKLFLGGEALPLTLANQLREALPAEIFNLYGPTETTVWSTAHKLAGVTDSVPIGRPIANTRTYIIDEAGKLAAIGAAGELYIGGAGVTRGYWKRPDLTAERFVVNRFEPGRLEILYRTGDIVRRREDGEIEFIGRTDQQVKLRGFRIELGEIEAVLGIQPAVQEVAVVTRGERGNDPQLVAYVVAKPGRTVTSQELKIHAREKLPEYMVPPVIRFLGAMPRTPNGKTDRNALPNPSFDAAGAAERGGFARTELEGIITEVWREALAIDDVGLHVNLFDLGATSLSVAEAAISLRQKLDREIPLTDLFAYPTIAALASYLSGTNGSRGNSSGDQTRGTARRQTLLRRTRAAAATALTRPRGSDES
ncbi:MAG: non-ribosomal peptide synthetase [Candidatus Binataceae bacterium]|nr:non-ribosomal peptide synthetase [Candidatus Binataceae bacterium]